jgi:hypothetical protein
MSLLRQLQFYVRYFFANDKGIPRTDKFILIKMAGTA